MSNVRSRKLSLFAAFITLLTLLVLPSGPARAADISIDCATDSLQTAVNSAFPGDRILIAAGTCSENILIDASAVNLTIEGAGAGLTTIDGGGLDTTIDITPGRTIALKNLTVTGGVAAALTSVLTDPAGDATTSDIVEVSEAVVGTDLRLVSDFGPLAATADVVVTMNFDVDENPVTGGSDGVLTGVDAQLLVRGDGTAEVFSDPFGTPVSEWTGASAVTTTSISVNVPLTAFGPTEDGDMEVHVISDNLVTPDTDDAGTGFTTAAGPVSFGGGIRSGATLSLDGVTVTGNTAESGAGIWNGGTLQVDNSTISLNTASGNGGGIYTASGTVTTTFSFLTDNGAVNGAGLYSDAGTVNVTSDTVVNLNTATDSGGGVYSSGGQLNVTASNISDNTAGAGGGGIYTIGSGAVLTIDTSSIDDNSAGAAGGVLSAGDTATITDSFVRRNQATNLIGNGGGGLYNVLGSSMTVIDTLVDLNTSAANGGAGIRNVSNGIISDLTLDGVTVTNNTATGVDAFGGGVRSSGVLDILGDSLIQGNAADIGGGVSIAGIAAVATIDGSQIDDNTATTAGGLDIQSGDDGLTIPIETTTVTITKSAITRNNATGLGGDGGGVVNNDALIIENSTISGNATAGGSGGGISNIGISPTVPASLTVSYSTIAENTAAVAGGGFVNNDPTAAATFEGTIIFGNTAAPTLGNDCSGALTTGGYNLVGLGTPPCVYTPDATDLPALSDPVLEPLTSGSPEYHPLGEGSDAIDAGGACTVPDDQPGTIRPQGPACDIGAFEVPIPNEPPVANNDSASVGQGQSVFVDVLDNDTDADGDELTPSIVAGPTNGTAAVQPDGTIEYTHDGSDNLSDSFTYRVNDGVSNSNTATVSITVIAATSEDLVVLVQPNGRWHLRFPNGTENTFFYGDPGDVPLFGDWNGDGLDTPGMFRPSNGFAYLTNTLPPDGGVGVGDPALTFFFGMAGDQVVVGDWNGDDVDTLGIRRGGKMFLTNVNATSVAEDEFFFGVPGDIAYGGDPDGDGFDSIFLYRATSGFVYYTNETPVGPSTVAPTADDFFYGVPSDQFVIGDWNADGVDTVGIFRPPIATVFLRNSNSTGPADETYTFGSAGWLPVAGVWS